jgi:hypothetical protein
MQIKPILAAAGAGACMFLGWSALVVAASNDGQSAVEEILITQAAAEGEPVEQTEIAPQPMSGGQEMTAAEKPAAIPIRSGRPRVERHRDARVCLDAGNNLAIIKCAEKYRYR